MKSILPLFILLFASQIYSQVDDNKSISIPSTNTNTETSVPAVDPNFGTTIPKYQPKSDKYKIGESKSVTFGEAGETFGNPGEKYEKKLNEKHGTESQAAIKGNQFFGSFKNNGDFVNIKFRDYEYADGDFIKISVNDVVVVASVGLINEFQTLDLPLQPGFNRIEFEALNQGSSGPNTAEFHVFDDKGEIIAANQWNLSTGFKATVIIVKEK